MFDVVVFSDNAGRDVVYRTGLEKRDAKRLVKELKKKGKKAHFVSSRNEMDENAILVDAEIQQERDAQIEKTEPASVAHHDKQRPQYNRYRDAWPKKEFVGSKKDSFEDYDE